MGVDVRRMGAQDYVRPATGGIRSPYTVVDTCFLAQQKAEAASSIASQSLFSPDPRTNRPPSFSRIGLRLLGLGPQYFFEALKVLLPASIFFFKFLEWWYSSDYARSRRGGAGDAALEPALRPPTRIDPHPEGVLRGEKKPVPGVCPICKDPLVNATALPTGWVADYKCAWDWVTENGTCPVTLVAVEPGDLRRIVG
jgi:peroxin-12